MWSSLSVVVSLSSDPLGLYLEAIPSMAQIFANAGALAPFRDSLKATPVLDVPNA